MGLEGTSLDEDDFDDIAHPVESDDEESCLRAEDKDTVTPLVSTPSPSSKSSRGAAIRQKMKKRYSFRVARAMEMAGGSADSASNPIAMQIAKLRQERNRKLANDDGDQDGTIANSRRVGAGTIPAHSPEGGAVSPHADVALRQMDDSPAVAVDIGSFMSRCMIAGSAKPASIFSSAVDADGFSSTDSIPTTPMDAAQTQASKSAIDLYLGRHAYARWSSASQDKVGMEA